MPDHTMGGLKVDDNGNANGTLHHRVLRVVLTSCIPHLYKPVSRMISTAFQEELSNGAKVKGGWTRVSSWSVAKTIITAANARTYFGADLANNPTFHGALRSFIEDLLFTAEILRWSPTFLRPFVGPLLMRNHRASQAIIKHLTPVVEERLSQARNFPNDKPRASRPVDCIQFFVDANSRKRQWTAKRIVQVLLGVWFASVHQPALTLVYALENLCEHPEYIEPLRKELSSSMDESGGTEIGKKNPAASLEDIALLDAFMKESSRLRPSDAISVRRKVMSTFNFKDGTQILPGDVACVPMNAILRDEAHYLNAEDFSPWRFLDENGQLRNSSRFTDVVFSYPLWGLGGHVW